MTPQTPSSPATTGLDSEQRILQVVRAVKRGQVASYAEVARRAGLPRHARWVARVLATSEEDTLPWHRIVRADGKIAFPARSAAYAEQCRRLLAEGVELKQGRVRMPSREENLDAALWAPR